MSDPLFLRRTRGLTLAEIAQLAGVPLPAAAIGDRRIVDVATIERAGPGDLTFLDKERFAGAAATTYAGACFTTSQFADRLAPRVIALIVREPYRSFVTVARELFPGALRPSSLYETNGVAGAHVHPDARLESGVIVDPGAVIGPRAEIGCDTIIAANAVIGADVRIGRGCSIGGGAIITNALIGDRVIIHAGCKIGQDGFEFLMTNKASLKIPQIGRVILQDGVEIGAGSTIDRGSMGDTIIGEGSKIDNLVQIGHNVIIGRYCVLAAQTGVSGSVTIGDHAMLGGQVGVAERVNIGEDAMLAGQSGLMSDVPDGERWGGSPARPRHQWLRTEAMMRRLGSDPNSEPAGSTERGERK